MSEVSDKRSDTSEKRRIAMGLGCRGRNQQHNMKMLHVVTMLSPKSLNPEDS